MGFADQASRPAVLPDGRIVLAWVDRFQTRTIRARSASAADAPFGPESEVVLYQHSTGASSGPAADTGEMLGPDGCLEFRLAFCRSAAERRRLGFYYAGSLSCMSIHWTRLSSEERLAHSQEYRSSTAVGKVP